MNDLIEFLKWKGAPIQWIAGTSTVKMQHDYLAGLVKRFNVASYAETGFNGGFSAYAILNASSDVHVWSFDNGQNAYSRTAKEFIDRKWPGRHELIIGDSKYTISQFAADHPVYFDMFLIDGGHDYLTAIADIYNFGVLARPESILVMDDLTPWNSWGAGPTKAWSQAIDDGTIEQDEIIRDGHAYAGIPRDGTWIWGRGHYILDRRHK